MMQIQADILKIPLYRPKMTEVTALGAAIAAGIAVGVWDDLSNMRKILSEEQVEDTFTSRLNDKERKRKADLWDWGVERSLGWVREELQYPRSAELSN
jgi:glycerol kinase